MAIPNTVKLPISVFSLSILWDLIVIAFTSISPSFFALVFNLAVSVVSATIITLVMIGLTAAYVYAVMYFKQYHDTGITVEGKLYQLDIAGGGYEANFLANYMSSIVVLIIADVLSAVACVLGFIHYDRAYEKGDR